MSANRLTAPALLLCVLLPVIAGVRAETLAGWVERARIEPSGPVLPAKLDTGAEHSSLYARDIERFQRDAADWVRFRVSDRFGNRFEFERPLLRVARIKRLGAPSQERPVVILEICAGPVRRAVEINLVDRSGFEYPLLLGRSFLAGHLLVDAGRRELLAQDCSVE